MKSPVAILYDAEGHPISIVADGSVYRLQTAITQNVVASEGNSSTTPLAARGVFTGASESTLGVAGIQVNFIADQPCTIQCQQSMEGTNWDIRDSFDVEAGVGDSETFQATGSFYRVVVTNNDWEPCTYLRLQTALCPIVEALPRSLGQKVKGKSLAVTLASDQIVPVEFVDEDGSRVAAATENTLYAIKGVQLEEMLSELRQIRKLMQILTDESVEDEE